MNAYVFQDFVFGIGIELYSVSSEEEEGLCIKKRFLSSCRGGRGVEIGAR